MNNDRISEINNQVKVDIYGGLDVGKSQGAHFIES